MEMESQVGVGTERSESLLGDGNFYEHRACAAERASKRLAQIACTVHSPRIAALARCKAHEVDIGQVGSLHRV